MKSALRLDWKGDARVAPDARLVETEVQWLRVAQTLRAPDAAGVWVRGAHLCEWAAQWWQGAGGTCEDVRNALDVLLALVPNLERDEARIIADELSARGHNSALHLREIAAVTFPTFGDDGALWKRNITADNRIEFAAIWLRWLEAQGTIEPARAKIIARQCEIWRETHREISALFPASPDAATGALRSWLGLNFEAKFAALPAFPLGLPPAWLHEARDCYARSLTRDFAGKDGGALKFWSAYERTNAPLALRKVAAQTLADWVFAHPQQISAALIFALEPFTSAETLSKLRDLQPPKTPGDLPVAKRSEANLIFDWVTQKYLPFRAWQCQTENAETRAVSLDAAAQFGQWFLDFYRNAMVGAARGWLQIHRAARLRFETSGEITFWVIADGLGWLDARALAQLISQANPRFSLLEMEPVFATIPTITRFAKPALRHSTTPDLVDEAPENEKRRETEVSGHKEAAGALQSAQVGDLILWKPLEPDKTYHENADASILRHRVAGALASLAHQIVEAAQAAPAEVPLQIVVTTDHGRMLGPSERAHAIPPGFVSSGRAAWGEKAPDLTNNPHLIWLDPELYNCGSHVVIVGDDGAFTTNASDAATARAGIEKFAHGGAFPEEVVVPWLVFGRDVGTLRLEAVLVGKGRAGRESMATLRLSNSSVRALTLESLELNYGAQTEIIALESAVLGRFSNLEIEVTIAVWPSANQAREVVIMLNLRAPDGRLVQSAVRAELQVVEMQTREDVLSDLI